MKKSVHFLSAQQFSTAYDVVIQANKLGYQITSICRYYMKHTWLYVYNYEIKKPVQSYD